ncbi:MAG: hypothetical protein C5B48_11995 [Candidatus Rokuibacteriota bacterium]|nr:MAG: hypothetical protein C5B48_11995 [Candidatus Rokubacteria bacterium]
MPSLEAIVNAPRCQKIVAGVFGLFVVTGLGYRLLISPNLGERASLRQQKDAFKAEVARVRADETRLRPFRQEAEALRRRLEAAKERLPSEKEMPRLYRQVTDLALQSGLHVALFAPKPPQERDDVAEAPIAMTSEGGYHQHAAFFSQIGRLPRIVDLGEFRLIRIERPTGTIRAEFTLETFFFRAEGALSRAKAGAASAAPAAAAPAQASAGAPGPHVSGAARIGQ